MTETRYETVTKAIAENKFQLAENRLLARIDVQQQHGSIILPESAQNELNTATIVCIAANLKAEDFPVGKHIIPAQYAGIEVCSKGADRLVIYDVTKDIHAVITDD